MSIQLDKVQPKNRVQLEQLIDYAFKHNIYDLNFIDTSKITDMCELFEYIEHNFDVSSWNVSNVVNMYCTFDYCKNFIGKGLENWNVSNVINMTGMFAGCEKFDCDLSNWDVSNVIDMKFTFNYCLNFKGKGLENWDVSNIHAMYCVFKNCVNLAIPDWYKSNV